MSTYTLYLWKAPVVDDPDVAQRLLEPYNEREDDSALWEHVKTLRKRVAGFN